MLSLRCALCSALLLTVAVSGFAAGVRIDDVLVDSQRLVVGDYEVVKALGDDGRWFVELRRGIDVVARHDEGGPSVSMASFGTFSLLGSGKEQLIVFQYSGGAHCCWSYWVYDLAGDEPRLIFDSTEYPVGYSMLVEDLDRDGVLELRQVLLSFDYFPLSHADSPFPPVVFAYDAETGRFIVASHRYPEIVLDGVEAEIAKLREWNEEPPTSRPFDSKYLSTALDVLLRYVYAGQDQKGWRLFEKFYLAPDAPAMARQIKDRLEGCRVHRALTSGPDVRLLRPGPPFSRTSPKALVGDGLPAAKRRLYLSARPDAL